MSDYAPFEYFHSDWEDSVDKVAVGEITDEKTRKWGEVQEQYEESLPVLSVTTDGVEYSEKKESSGGSSPNSDLSDYLVVERGDIVYNPLHMHRGSIAVQNLVDRGLVSPRYLVFSVSDEVSTKYIHSILHSEEALALYDSIGIGSARKELRADTFKQLELPVPELEEQHRVVSVLDAVDQHIDALSQRHDYLTDLKHGLMQDLLTGKTRVRPEEGVLPDVVDGDEATTVDEEQVWKEEFAGELIESFESGLSYDSDDEVSSPTEDSIPVAGTGAIKNQSVIPEEMAHVENVSDEKRESLALSEGDVLMVAASGSDKRLGEAVTVDSDWDALFGTFVTRMRSEKINYHYLGYYLNSGRVQSKLDGLARGSTSLNNLNKSDLKLMEIDVPPLWEQERIASVLYTADEMIARTGELRDEYDQLKRGLMQDLLSGDVRTPETLEALSEVVQSADG